MNKYLDNALIYQIYPASFFDSDGDGIGDFKGIIAKIPYLRRLNVDVIWLNPVFLSPFMDGGYDVTDYSALNPSFGSLGDLKELLTLCHLCNMKVLMDFIPGHTSVTHRWFRESCKSERNKYSDFYIWTGSWAEDEPHSLNGISDRNGCVLTNYYSFQPALNYGYENPQKAWQIHYKDERLAPLRNEIISVLKQWINFGFDGFRIDLASSLVKGRTTEEPLIWLWNNIISEIRTLKEDAIFLAEWGDPALSVGKCGFDIDYLNHENREYNSLLRLEENSNVLRYYEGGNSFFNIEGKGNFEKYAVFAKNLYESVGDKGYFSFPSGYHDIPRISVGRSEDGIKAFFAFLFTYKHMPQLYYGDEIGMSYNDKVSKYGGYQRTGARTPMQWNSDLNRGFTTSRNPFLPVGEKAGQDVESQSSDEKSVLNTVVRLSLLRRTNRAFYVSSDLDIIENGYPLVYERSAEGQKFIVLINPSGQTFERTVKYSEAAESNNCEIKKDKIILKAESFAILKK